MITILLSKNLVTRKKVFFQLMVCVLSISCFGCSKTRAETLVDVLKGAGGTKVVSIEQIDLITTNGLPGAKAVLAAKVLKTFSTKLEIEAFEKSIISAHKPGDYNHPTVSDDLVLRVKTTNGIWTVLCRVLTLRDAKTCFVEAGAEGETNFNRMTLYESKLLFEWIEKNLGKLDKFR